MGYTCTVGECSWRCVLLGFVALDVCVCSGCLLVWATLYTNKIYPIDQLGFVATDTDWSLHRRWLQPALTLTAACTDAAGTDTDWSLHWRWLKLALTQMVLTLTESWTDADCSLHWHCHRNWYICYIATPTYSMITKFAELIYISYKPANTFV